MLSSMSNGLFQPSALPKYKGGEKDTVLLLYTIFMGCVYTENKYKEKTIAIYKSMDRE